MFSKSQPVNIECEKGKPGPEDRYDHTAVWLNGLVYVGGGYANGQNISSIDCYDPDKDSWGSSIRTSYKYFALTTLNNKLVTAGGQSVSDSKTTKEISEVYNDQLKSCTNMMEARSHATAAGYQGMLIITGGNDDHYKTLSSTEVLYSKNQKWYKYKCNDLPHPLSELRSVITDNILYLLGRDGYSYNRAFYATSLDTLFTHLLEWNKYEDTPCSHTTPVSVNGRHLLTVGGYKKDDDKTGCSSDIYKFNKVTNSWEALGSVSDNLARKRSAAVSIANNKVIVMGGTDDKGLPTKTVLIVSFETKSVAS